MNSDLKTVVGEFIKTEYLENRMTVERAQEIAEATVDLDKIERSDLNFKAHVVNLALLFPEIDKVIEKYFATI
ncbi:MAG: hypothetical protein NT141_03160 [candidate division WWE3 bacterium]|nr:hypothetical protein [candidate division WWE3 bacterium]